MASSSSAVQIILDHASPSMSFSPSDVWENETSQLWYGGASSWARFSSSTDMGSFEVTFQGTDIAFFGNTPPDPDSLQTFLVSIDSDESGYEVDYPESKTNCQWFTSYALDDSRVHIIEISKLVQIDVDFAVVTVGNSTPLTGSTIIVDDANEEIVWNGQWNEHRGIKYVTGLDDGRPFGNGTRESQNVGDSMKFTFAGTNIAVYGIFDWKASGSVTVDFSITNPTLDNSSSYSEEKSFFVASTPNPADLQNSTNYPLFSHDSLVPGNHTLTLNVIGIVGSRSFTIDYLTYEPSFGSLSAKPNFTSITNSSSGSDSGSGTSSGNNGSSSGNSSPDNPGSGKSSKTGAIAGGVVGGAVVIVIAFGLFVWYRRRNKNDLQKARGYEYSSALIANNPDMTNSSRTDFNQIMSQSTNPRSTKFPSPLRRDPASLQDSQAAIRNTSPAASASTSVTPFPYGASSTPTRSKGSNLNLAPRDMSIQQRNEELRKLNGQMTEMRELIAHSPIAGGSVVSSHDTEAQLNDQIRLLQERIEALTRENERLGGYDRSGPPPMYVYEDAGNESTVRGSFDLSGMGSSSEGGRPVGGSERESSWF